MSCLFNSLSYFIPNVDSNSIRQQICDYLERNEPIIDGLETNFILSMENPNYISNMRQTFVWGGAIEIQVACNLWNLQINVRNYRDCKGQIIEFLPIVSSPNRIIELEWTGGHYEPVRNY